MPERDTLAAIFLKGHLRLLQVGLKNSQMTGTQVLKKVTALTGKDYKLGQYDTALEDIKEYLK